MSDTDTARAYANFCRFQKDWFRRIAGAFVSAMQDHTRPWVDRLGGDPMLSTEVGRVCRDLVRGVFITPFCRIAMFLYIIVGLRGDGIRMSHRVEALYLYIDYRIRRYLDEELDKACTAVKTLPPGDHCERMQVLQSALLATVWDAAALGIVKNDKDALKRFSDCIDAADLDSDEYRSRTALVRNDYDFALRVGLKEFPTRVNPRLLEHCMVEEHLSLHSGGNQLILNHVIDSFLGCLLNVPLMAIQAPDAIAAFLLMVTSMPHSGKFIDSPVMRAFIDRVYPKSVAVVNMLEHVADMKARADEEDGEEKKSRENENVLAVEAAMPDTPLMSSQQEDESRETREEDAALHCSLDYPCLFPSCSVCNAPRAVSSSSSSAHSSVSLEYCMCGKPLGTCSESSPVPPPGVVLNDDPVFEGVVRLFETTD